jgi:hypothetical protein
VSRAPRAAIVLVALLGVLIAVNGFTWWRTQRDFVPEDRPRLVPRNIALVAALNNYDPVRTTFHMYYGLRELRGATLVIPEAMRGHRFLLEEVSRLRVEVVAGDPPALANDVLDRLRYDHQVTRTLHLDGSSWLDVVIRRDARRYLLTRTADGQFFVILPDELYQASRRA